MTRENSRTPTEAELRILKVLWRKGPATARGVLEILEDQAGGKVGYTTVLKMLQIMEKKELVSVDRSERSHVYSPRVAETPTLRQAVSEFVDRTFGGDPAGLLVHLVRDGRLDERSLEELERSIELLRRSEEEQEDR
ncbi:MAG: BlaI/MecI/CopY family transcriptional regulator [Planctomycetes bacterium]|nr:BlaI/MecI/CopY family transcriptional regulator [Planctomycetota bacterium]